MWDLPTIWDQLGLLKESSSCWCLQSTPRGSRSIDMSIHYVYVMSCWEGYVWQDVRQSFCAVQALVVWVRSNSPFEGREYSSSLRAMNLFRYNKLQEYKGEEGIQLER